MDLNERITREVYPTLAPVWLPGEQIVRATSLTSLDFPITSSGEIDLELSEDWGKLEAQMLE